ncbi:unnamed protein product [Pedinophyceae sp. YPF-701]|nr:unnamed protein product [Pedinophyceae sp. YPF-701]
MIGAAQRALPGQAQRSPVAQRRPSGAPRSVRTRYKAKKHGDGAAGADEAAKPSGGADSAEAAQPVFDLLAAIKKGPGATSTMRPSSVPLGPRMRILEIPNLRDKLEPRTNPFCDPNGTRANFDTGFVTDDDYVVAQALNRISSDHQSVVNVPDVHKLGASSTLPVPASAVGATPLASSMLSMDDDGSVSQLYLQRAGARRTIYFNPETTTAAIVTCGGLCPGLNDVVMGLVRKLEDYGVPEGNILGLRYGFRGFYDNERKPIVLTTRHVEGIQTRGGTVLGTSRGGAKIEEMVKKISLWGINQLYVIGGNGGNAGALAIHEECVRQGVVCSVVGIPKSIDNDILMIDKTFGFDTAVEEAQKALMAANVEATSAHRGVGLVKLMGRQSGFIAMQASLASGVVDACLIPEVPFHLDGEAGLLAYLEKVIKRKGHAVVCVAEGAGQDMLTADGAIEGTDASGNPILKDIGLYLKKRLTKELPDATVKYIDPTYMIRAIPTTANDRIYCTLLAMNAVHAAFAGYTGITIGLCNTHYALLPTGTVISAARTVNPQGKMWNRLRHSTGQPEFDGPPLSN